jgi:hypothetical protein
VLAGTSSTIRILAVIGGGFALTARVWRQSPLKIADQSNQQLHSVEASQPLINPAGPTTADWKLSVNLAAKPK